METIEEEQWEVMDDTTEHTMQTLEFNVIHDESVVMEYVPKPKIRTWDFNLFQDEGLMMESTPKSTMRTMNLDPTQNEGVVIFRSPKPTMHLLNPDLIQELKVIHGDKTIPPLYKMELGNLFHFVRPAWQAMGLQVGTRLQRCVWPQIIRGHDSFIVDLKGSGKTLSYLSPICAMLLGNIVEWKQLKGTGPVVIIFTRNGYGCLRIEHLVKTFLLSCGNNEIRCKAVTNYKAKTVELCSKGIEIIITTPEVFLDKAEKYAWLQFDRLKFFVVADAHYNLRSKESMVGSLFDKYQRSFLISGKPAQIIVCGSEWFTELESLYWRMPRKPTVIIGSVKSAIPYSGIKYKVHHVEPAEKLTFLIDMLNRHTSDPAYNRVIVVCKSTKSCQEVHKRIAKEAKYTLRHCSERTDKAVKEYQSNWKNAASDECVVFVVDDEMLKWFDVSDASYLIHYDIEDDTQEFQSGRGSAFFYRFTCLWDKMRNIAEEEKESTTTSCTAMSDILMTTEEKDMHIIINAFVTIGLELPKAIVEKAIQIRKEKESRWPLCEMLKNMGYCDVNKTGTCDNRHSFSAAELKMEPLVPRNGKVKVLVTNCSSANSFTVKLLRIESSDLSMEPMDINKECNQRQNFLKNHFALKKNRCQPKSIEVNSLYAVLMVDTNVYTRGKVLKVLTRHYDDKPDEVRVFCVDTGEFVTLRAHDALFQLPEALKDIPQLSVEIILVGVRPPIPALKYSMAQYNFVKSLTVNKVFKAKVCMSVANTVWVSSMRMKETGNNTSVSISEQLFRNNHAIPNHIHENWITTVTSENKDPLSEPLFVSSFYTDLDGHHQWSSIHVIESYAKPTVEFLTVSKVVSPQKIFVIVDAFINSLCKLQDDIQTETNMLLSCRYKKRDHFTSYYIPGRLAVVENGGKWFRCVITEVIESEKIAHDGFGQLLLQPEKLFTVFLVDFGDTVKDIPPNSLFPILTKHVTQLAFQAVWIELDHIWKGNWTSECINYLTEKLESKHLNNRLVVTCYVSLDRKSNKCYPQQSYYVMAFTPNSRYEELGVELVEKGFAQYYDFGRELYLGLKEHLPKRLKRDLRPDSSATDTADEDTDFISDSELRKSILLKGTESLPPVVVETNENADKPPPMTEETKLPPTRWRQTVDHLIITICVPDIVSHRFETGENRELVFSCSPNYKFEIQTFGFMKLEQEMKIGQYVQAKFRKSRKGMWPQITKVYSKLHWLRPDNEGSKKTKKKK